MVRFSVLTLFPEIFASPLKVSILGRAIEGGKICVDIINLRDFAKGRHKVVDDKPFGGGKGMLIKPEPVIDAINSVKSTSPGAWVILLSPYGQIFDQEVAKSLSKKNHLLLVCGHYEGIDERVRHFIDEEISLGDFVLTGGEVAALAIIDAVSRLVPNVLGSYSSLEEESFSNGILEYPQYTRPREYKGYKVPEVLLSGHHKRIRQWRRRQALLRTLILRPDLLERARLEKEDIDFLIETCKLLEKRLHEEEKK
ncbi:MAG: tRNA (guanosine(37)-N1)-methyltransferase TrmD [Deltaproteobacteria bacterium]|nr:tRNA (guanosine(37)-N1)-methyltransferase TrmD [Deltaproteobacteria bacterium]